MTAAPNSTLVERVAVAISQWMNCKKLPQPPAWDRLQESTREAYRQQAHAAIAACHVEDLTAAVRANDALIREIRHRDARWHDDELVRQLLDRNRALLAKLGD